MPYATIFNVQAYTPKRIYTANSIPNLSQITIFLQDCEAEVNGLLAGDGYTVPVPTTATISYNLLQRIVSIGAWAQIEQAAQVSNQADRVLGIWERSREEIVKGIVQFADAPRLLGENYARANPYASPQFTSSMML